MNVVIVVIVADSKGLTTKNVHDFCNILLFKDICENKLILHLYLKDISSNIYAVLVRNVSFKNLYQRSSNHELHLFFPMIPN
ncbi:hypothetical protein BpHYR1_049914 [Brachionus plicatilis]|uniref:Uncharacterized protein n=1 Tax=Brachionus plicatilis TaxID=10195 RepID=A0A3M7SJQ8_BRAPC|nr:hypothetical protein BpHYR1_049914 [Brachionus plicatilis]